MMEDRMKGTSTKKNNSEDGKSDDDDNIIDDEMEDSEGNLGADIEEDCSMNDIEDSEGDNGEDDPSDNGSDEEHENEDNESADDDVQHENFFTVGLDNMPDLAALLISLRLGRIKMIEQFKQVIAHFQVDVNDHRGWTIMMELCKMGLYDLVKYMIDETDVDLDIRGRDGHTALYYAVKGGYKKIVQILLENGADITTIGRDNTSLSECVLYSSDFSMIQLFEMNNFDINCNNKVEVLRITNSNGGGIIPHILAEKDFNDMVYMFDHGLNLFLIEQSEKYSWLHHAVMNQDFEMVRFLYNLGGSLLVNHRDKTGSSPLLYAEDDCFDFLVSVPETDVNIESKNSETALTYTVMFDEPQKIKALIDRGIDIDKLAGGTTALMVATNFDKMKALRYLVSMGADVNIQDSKGMTALMVGIQNNNLRAVQCLVEEGNANLFHTTRGKSCKQLAKSENMRSYIDSQIEGKRSHSTAIKDEEELETKRSRKM